eukprot:CAMPEP_0202964178 /NCGR_PEP_ID=MMETSP1396-20130829/8259_1 /ASSEMBLY_ACC=CAM_ASM_000872 /TAXON_ID= /ORGANISM="Pseudokeronopsis sp., Strain Brazil" /LENGTH=249 /DNA_ID=CAMNT_0049686081 /DNA_START=394 /DNA_END=1143 /DNA_ORIENTATION=-
MPKYSIRHHTKLSWFPEHTVAFIGRDSPGMAKYRPEDETITKTKIEYSVGREDRFFEPPSQVRAKSQIPVAYETNMKDLKEQYKGAFIGYGQKRTYKTGKDEESVPGPIYETQSYQSIGRAVSRAKGIKDTQFGNTYDKYDKVFFRGAASHFLGREGKGPGAYYNSGNNDLTFLSTTRSRSQLKYSVPKGDRGLLTMTKNDKPGPASYWADFSKLMKQNGNFSIGKQTRDYHFSKYNSIHAALVEKGLF